LRAFFTTPWDARFFPNAPRRLSRIVDAQPDLGREDDRDCLFCRVFAPLIRMGVLPRFDPGAVANDGRQRAAWAASNASSTAEAA